MIIVGKVWTANHLTIKRTHTHILLFTLHECLRLQSDDNVDEDDVDLITTSNIDRDTMMIHKKRQ